MPTQYPIKQLKRIDGDRMTTIHADRYGENGIVIDLKITFRLRLGDILTGISPERADAIVLTANDNAFHRLSARYGLSLARLASERLSDLVMAELLFLIKCGFYYTDLEAVCILRRP